MSTTDQEIKNVVLVHGAFADGSGWRGVYDDLTARGFKVTIVQNPLTSLEDDVAACVRIATERLVVAAFEARLLRVHHRVGLGWR